MEIAPIGGKKLQAFCVRTERRKACQVMTVIPAVLSWQVLMLVMLSVSKGDVRKLIIFSQPRTGSTYLCELLSRYPNIIMHGEIFNPVQSRQRTEDGLLIPSRMVDLRRISPHLYLDWLWASYNNTGNSVGFKIFPSHLRRGQVIRELLRRNTDAKKIVLYRSDLLAAFTSNSIAYATGYWVRKNSSDNSIKINYGNFKRYETETLNWYGDIVSILNSSGQKYFIIEYAKDLLHGNETRRMLDNLELFLNIPYADILNRTRNYSVKQSQVPLRNQIMNWNLLGNDILKYNTRYYTLFEMLNSSS